MGLIYNNEISEYTRGKRCALFNRETLGTVFLEKEDLIKLKNLELDDLATSEIEELSEMKVLIDENENYIKEDLKNNINISKPTKCDFIRLVMTQNCNLKCKYCFVEEKPSAFSESNLQNLVEFIKKNCKDNLELQFFGGEPLLKFEILKNCVQLLKKECSDININYIITTNGTLINDEIAKFFYENNFSVFISLDGDEMIHNSYRKYSNGKGSYEDTIRGVKYLQKYQVNLRALITYNSYNSGKLDYVVKHLITELKIYQLALNSPQPSELGWNIDGAQLAKDIRNSIRVARAFGVKFYTIGDKILNALSTRIKPQNACSRIDDRYSVTITPDFKVSFCNVCWNDNITCAKENEISKLALKWREQNSSENFQSRCNKCDAKKICNGPCPLEAYYENKSNKVDTQKCTFFREFLKWAIWI